MKPNPFASLLHSRKFWLLFIDVAMALASLFITNHLKPDLVVELLTALGILQPLWIMVVVGITKEDVSKTDSYEWARNLAKAMREDDAVNEPCADESPVG